jgi:hypothetical protein
LNTRGRLLTSILHLKTLRQIICCNKTQDNEARRSLLGRSRSSLRFRAARPTSGSCNLARRFNQTPGWRSIIVVPLSTSVAQAGRGPSAVSLSQGAAGLSKDSVALCHQVTTLDRAKLTQRIGEFEFNGTESGRRWHQGRNGLAVALGSRITA